jgi:hypothetical protein
LGGAVFIFFFCVLFWFFKLFKGICTCFFLFFVTFYFFFYIVFRSHFEKGVIK